MRVKVAFLLVVICVSGRLHAQTNSVTSGDWNDATIWSTGAVPGGATVVNVSHPVSLNQNITITTGDYFFGYNGTSDVSANVTDLPGGTAYTLTAVTAGGVLDIREGTTTFEGAATFDNSSIFVRSGATLITGVVSVDNGTAIVVESGGTWIVNGNFTNSNNGGGSFSLAGTLEIKGNYSAPNGSVEISGAGSMTTTGTINTTGSSAVFGSTNECSTGPCSGTTLNCSFANAISPTSAVVCSGSTSGTLSANTTGTTPSYQWQRSTTSATTGFSDISGATSSTYTSGSLTQTTWFRVNKTVSGCTSSSAAVQVTVLSGGGWLGTTNDWNVNTNWCSGTVPTSSTDVTISPFPSGSGKFMPTISNANASVNNLTIASGASLTISSPRTLSIHGNFVNNGTFTDNSSVSLQGTSSQTVSGTSAITMNNLTVNNAAGIILNSNNLQINSSLTLTSGLMNLSGFTVTVGTSAGSTGSLSRTSGYLFGGNVTRWYPTSSVTTGSATSLFPLGNAAGNYRPFYVGNSGLTAGGTIKVSHTSVDGATLVSFTDNATSIQARSNSFWTVTTANGIGTGTHSLSTEGTGFGTVNAVTELRLTQSGSAIGTPGTNAGTSTNPQVNRTGLTTAQLTNAFYWGSTNSTTTPLPVELTSFEVLASKATASLTWSTASQLNFSHFEIERSANAVDWVVLHSIEGKGTTNDLLTYSYVDEQPMLGKNYYRLRVVDLDQTFEYSPIEHVEVAGDKRISLSPNPAAEGKTTYHLNFVPQSGTITLYDLTGMELYKARASEESSEIALPPTITAGTYFVRYTDASVSVVARLLVR